MKPYCDSVRFEIDYDGMVYYAWLIFPELRSNYRGWRFVSVDEYYKGKKENGLKSSSTKYSQDFKFDVRAFYFSCPDRARTQPTMDKFELTKSEVRNIIHPSKRKRANYSNGPIPTIRDIGKRKLLFSMLKEKYDGIHLTPPEDRKEMAQLRKKYKKIIQSKMGPKGLRNG